MAESTAPATRAGDFERAYSQLCHLLALTRSGKVEAALDDLVTTTLVLDPSLGSQNAAAISNAISILFGLKPPTQDVDRSVKRLLEDGRLARTSDSSVAVEAATADEVARRVREARDLEDSVRREWLEGLDPPQGAVGDWHATAWRGLQSFMADHFRRHGALTLQLLDSARAPATTGSYAKSIERASAEASLDEAWLRYAVADFFNSQTAMRSKYLAQLLDGTFSFYALTVDDTTASFLQNTVSPLDLFLDTNFIFAVLQFHQDFFANVSREAISLIRDSALPITLYYHERTLREIDTTIFAIGGRLRQHHWTKALSRAAVTYANATGHLSGIELAYHRINAETPVEPATFLAKYEHIEHVLEGEGFKIFREPTNRPSFSLDEKAQLIARYLEFSEQMRPGRPKAYEAVDHDMTVWLSLRRLRRGSRSALETGALLLSNDFLLHLFDWRELRQHPNAGTVVLPTQLLQLLRPFVPNTDDYDRRFAETFAVPEFRASHVDYAELTSKVLGILATFKDLPEATAAKILRDEVLAGRIRTLDEASPEAREAIESAIVQDNAALLEERAALELQIAETEAAMQSVRSEHAAVERAHREDRVRLTEEREAVEAAQAKVAARDDDLRKAQWASADFEAQAERSRRLLRFVVAAFVALLGSIILVALNVPGIGPLAAHQKWAGINLLLVVMILASALAVALPQHRVWVIGAGVVGAVIALATIL